MLTLVYERWSMGATRVRGRSFRAVPRRNRPRVGSQIYLSTYLYLSIFISALDRCIHVHTRASREPQRGLEKSALSGGSQTQSSTCGKPYIYLWYLFTSTYLYLYAIFINCIKSIYTQTSQHKKKCTHWIYTIFWYYNNCILEMYNDNKV